MKSGCIARQQSSQCQMGGEQNLHTEEPLPYCSADSTIPYRKPPKQRQHGEGGSHDSSISFLSATQAAQASITARQHRIQTALWMQFVTDP